MKRYPFFLIIFLTLPIIHVMGVEVIVVCPPAWQPELDPWIKQRADEGITAILVAPKLDASSTLKVIRAAASDQTRYVLLVGDSPAVGDTANPNQPIPIHYLPTTVTAAWNSTKTFSTDWIYGDLDHDGTLNAAVGRLPVRSAEELANAIKKQIQHESSQDFGTWRNRVELVGGVGGFGPLIDTAIETVSRTIVTGVLPRHVTTRVRFGSVGHRFYPTNKPFTQTVLDDYAQGARFWVYAGHGQVTQLDRVPQTIHGQPVLDRHTVEHLEHARDHRPIAILLACYTGAMDAREDCIAENLWQQANGPVAVIAGGRVTMPYGNTATAMGLIDAVFEQKVERLGDAWISTLRELEEAKPVHKHPARLMVDGLAGMVSPAGADLVEERKEHARLYNLIGDPTLRLRHAKSLELQTKTGFDAGVPVQVRLTSPIDGELSLTLAKPLGSVVQGDANDLIIQEKHLRIAAQEPVDLEFLLDEHEGEDFAGSIVIRAHVAGHQSWAAGATTTNLRSP